MPLFEYVLLALLGSGAAAADGSAATPPEALLDADAIVQPNGGALSSVGQKTVSKLEKGSPVKSQQHRRRRHQSTRHRKPPTPRTPKKEG